MEKLFTIRFNLLITQIFIVQKTFQLKNAIIWKRRRFVSCDSTQAKKGKLFVDRKLNLQLG